MRILDRHAITRPRRYTWRSETVCHAVHRGQPDTRATIDIAFTNIVPHHNGRWD